MRNRFDLQELNGALGDIGTLLPLALGCIALAGMPAMQVLGGFGLFYVVTGIVYRLPVPVQPMKAIAAVAMVADVSPASIAASGVVIGAVLLVLGASGLIDRIGRLVPQSVLAGLQLGLGLGLGWIALGLMQGSPVIGMASLGVAVLLLWLRKQAALAALAVGIGLGAVLGAPAPSLAEATWRGAALPFFPTVGEIRVAVTELALPQMALTLTNAVILTALVAGDHFGARAAHVTPRRLCLTSGAANLLLTPFGALPMCHGAGGLAAHYRFGARSGGAPILIGAMLLVVAALPPAWSARVLTAIPEATLGALLLVAAIELAVSRRLIDCKPSCRPVIAATAAATVLVNPMVGLVAGSVAELLRIAIVRRLRCRL
jgi:hypothetical protein